MKKIIKSRFFLVIFTALICICGTAYAASGLTARNIGYSDDTAKAALDDLYKKADRQSIEIKKVCQYQSEGSFGAKGTVGAKYKCQLGAEDSDNNGVIYRYFYILAINNDNTVDLIMDRNITGDTIAVSFDQAMRYFDDNTVLSGQGVDYKTKWVNVLKIDLPSAQDIANAVGNTGWNVAQKAYDNYFYFDKNGNSYGQTQVANVNNKSAYAWLFNHLRNCWNYGCTSEDTISKTDSDPNKWGYWTKNVIAIYKNNNLAWRVGTEGILNAFAINGDGNSGVRPVITLLKSNLYD